MNDTDRQMLLEKCFARATSDNLPLSTDQNILADIYKEKMIYYGQKQGYAFRDQEVTDYINKQFEQVNSLYGNTPYANSIRHF